MRGRTTSQGRVPTPQAKAKADKLEAALAQAQAMQAELLRRMSAVESKQRVVGIGVGR